MTNEEKDLHQLLMDKAYNDERKRTDADPESTWSYNRMVREASDLERMAVVLGNLNYQVENGGFNQWVDNGYCTHISDVKECLELIDTETTRKILPMVETVEEFLLDEVISGSVESRGCGGWYFDDEKCGRDMESCYDCGGSGEIENPDYDDEDEDCDEEQMIECSDCCGEGEVEGDVDYPNFNGEHRCGDLNSEFYSINTQFLEDIKTYIKTHQVTEEAK
jgi:hypothetical protein